MRRAVAPTLVLLVPSGALAGVVVALPDERTRAGAAYLLSVGALGLLALLRMIRRSRRARRSAFELALAERSAGPSRLRELDRVEHDVIQGLANPLDLHRRLRPLLREIAAQRLTAGHGIDLDARPDAARALLGDEVWELVRADRPEPDEMTGRRLPATELARAVTVLEAV